MIDTQTQQNRNRRIQPPSERMWLVPMMPSDHFGSSALLEGTTDIGSGPDCDIRIPVDGVEAHHCSIRVDDGRAELTAHSRMTWVNEGPIRKTFLKPGQRLAIGPVEFRIESRTEQITPDALEQLDRLQRIVAGTDGHSLANVPNVTDIKGTDTPVPNPETAPSPQAEVPDITPVKAQRRSLTNGEENAHVLERRRILVEELQRSLDEQALVTLQALKGSKVTQRQNRDELNRLLNELTEEQAALCQERQALSRQQSAHRRRLSKLQEDEQSHFTRQAELQQTIEQLEEERREQSKRERLLQFRIEEINREEAAVSEREADLQRRQQEREEQQASLHANTDELAAELKNGRKQWQQQRAELEDSLQSLRHALRQKEDELKRLENARQQQQSDLAEREAALRQRETDIADQADQLEKQEAAIRLRTAELENRNLALGQQQQEIGQRTAELNLEMAAGAEAGHTDSQHNDAEASTQLDARRRELDEEHSQLQADRDLLTRTQNDLRQESERLSAERGQLEADRDAIHAEREALATERNSLEDDLRKFDEDRRNLEEQQLRWEVRQQEIFDIERRVASQLSDIERRRQELDSREDLLRQRETELAAQAVDKQPESSEEYAETRKELDELRQSLLDERTRLEAEKTVWQEQRQSIEADREELQAAQAEIQRQISVQESARDELVEEKERLDESREQLLRDQASLTDQRNRLTQKPDQPESFPPSLAAGDDESSNDAASAASSTADHYEVSDSRLDTLEDDLEDEVVEDVTDNVAEDVAIDETAEGDGSELRSQLAEMFGMSSVELAAKAQRETSPVEESTARIEQAASARQDHPPEQNSDGMKEASPELDNVQQVSGQEQPEAVSEETDDPNSIATYMENLLARNRRGEQSDAVIPPEPVPLRKQAGPVTNSNPESAADQGADDQPANASAPVIEKERKRPDTEFERANLDSFRELANRSARTAVARHNSDSLRNTYVAKAIVTASLFVTTILLMTAHFWVGVSYASWCFVAAAAMCVSAFELLKTVSQLQANNMLQAKAPDEES